MEDSQGRGYLVTFPLSPMVHNTAGRSSLPPPDLIADELITFPCRRWYRAPPPAVPSADAAHGQGEERKMKLERESEEESTTERDGEQAPAPTFL